MYDFNPGFSKEIMKAFYWLISKISSHIFQMWHVIYDVVIDFSRNGCFCPKKVFLKVSAESFYLQSFS